MWYLRALDCARDDGIKEDKSFLPLIYESKHLVEAGEHLSQKTSI
ncbi:hypothetical protein ACKUV4_015405 [Acinetobacter baumannii]